MHFCIFFAFFVNFSYPLLFLCILSTYIRLFGITAGFHRYFSHKTFKTNRFFQFILGLLGTFSAQQGPLWWAAHHRHHHKYSDTPNDTHSPYPNGFFHAHLGWLFKAYNDPIKKEYVTDLLKYKELYLLDKYYYLIVIGYAVFIFYLGYILNIFFPSWGITGFSSLVWGFFISTILLYHITFSINSIMHLFGSRAFNTKDSSKNNFLLSIFTLGEAWHNNHHRYPTSQRQGFIWWQIDITHLILSCLKFLGLIWDVKSPPRSILKEGGYQ